MFKATWKLESLCLIGLLGIGSSSVTPASAEDLAWAGYRGPAGNGAVTADLPSGDGGA